MTYFKYYSPSSHKRMKNVAVASLKAMSLTPEEDVSFGPLQLPVAWESQDVRSPPEDGQEPTGGTSFRGVCKAGHIFIYEWAATPQSSGRRAFVLFSPPAQRQPSAKQSAKGHLILSPLCPFLGPGREALTGTHSIAASTSNSQITNGTAPSTHRVRNAALLRCIATNKARFHLQERRQATIVQHTQGYAVPPHTHLKDTQPIYVSPHILQPVFMHWGASTEHLLNMFTP